MGLLQKAVETYDFLDELDYVGVKKKTEDEILAPIAHVITRAHLEITLNAKGDFLSARAVGPDEPKIIIPATEKSAGRAGINPTPHPLCDQLWYIAPYNEKKHAPYVEQLEKWVASPFSHAKTEAVLHYVKQGRIVKDLERAGLIDLDDKGKPKDEKLLVRWCIVNSGEQDECWLDRSLFQSFCDYYESQFGDEQKTFCMITGNKMRTAAQHPKGIVSANGNAKLISSNDTSGFTYLGRFTDADQVVGISYEASQKAHNALRWLIANQGAQAVYGGRTFICWNPHGKEVQSVFLPFMDLQETTMEPTAYRSQLQKTLDGKKEALPANEDVVLAAFDAATSGRLALTYYNELMYSDFIQRLHDWDEHCCWYNGQFGIQSPLLWQIVNCAFGTQQNEKLKTDDRVLRQQMQRLVACRIDQAKIPTDILKALVQRASRPQAYERYVWWQILFVACAVIRKYRYDYYKEDCQMELDEQMCDRSYLFGRLLAIYEKIEQDTFLEGETRETNAMRLHSVFCQRPMYVLGNLEKQVERAYFPRLPYKIRVYYKKMLGEIMSLFEENSLEYLNQPLNELYLTGYYLQRRSLYLPKNKEKLEESNND